MLMRSYALRENAASWLAQHLTGGTMSTEQVVKWEEFNEDFHSTTSSSTPAFLLMGLLHTATRKMEE